MNQVLTLSIDDRERAAIDEIRAIAGLRTDEDVLRSGLYKLAFFLEPNVDISLFALQGSPGILRREMPPPEPDIDNQPSLFEAES